MCTYDDVYKHEIPKIYVFKFSDYESFIYIKLQSKKAMIREKITLMHKNIADYFISI